MPTRLRNASRHLVDGLEELATPRPVFALTWTIGAQGANESLSRASSSAFASSFFVEEIDLVEGDHDAAAAIDGEAEDLRVLLGHALVPRRTAGATTSQRSIARIAWITLDRLDDVVLLRDLAPCGGCRRCR